MMIMVLRRVLPQSSLQVLSDYYCDANDGEECDSIGKENISPIDGMRYNIM